MIINLISGPRNVSTALMYSFAQRADTRVIDEPFYGYYLYKTGADHPDKQQVMKVQPTDADKVAEEILRDDSDDSVVFIKNMAHHLDGVKKDFLKNVRNIFLIRDPEAMILSFIKKIPEPTLQDTAYAQQYRLFRYVTHTLNQQPLVIDSAELLKDPENVLNVVCNRLSVDYDENMLHWPAGPIPEDGVWAEHWYGNVHRSTGFEPYLPPEGRLPEGLEPLLEDCQNYYKRLFNHAIKSKY